MRIINRRKVRLVIALSVIGCALVVYPALAQETEWRAPAPDTGTWDWLMLTSGEWIGGEIDLMRDDKLFFDSDELDDLEIDWTDIAEIRSPRILTYTFLKGGVVTGTSIMKDGIIKVDTGSGIREFKRTDLLSILVGKPREINFWVLRTTAGIIVRSGNTEQADMSTAILLRRDATRTRFNFDYTGNVGTVQKERTVNNHRVTTNYSIYMSRRLFITAAAMDAYNDRFQNTDYRITFGAGVGYYLWRTPDFDWFLQLGGGYQTIQFVSVQPGEDQNTQSASVIPGLAVEWDITGDIDLDFNYSAQIGVPDPKNSFQHAFALFSIELTDHLDFDTTFQWDHTETPVADAEGNVPKRDDYRLSVGLGIDI